MRGWCQMNERRNGSKRETLQGTQGLGLKMSQGCANADILNRARCLIYMSAETDSAIGLRHLRFNLKHAHGARFGKDGASENAVVQDGTS